ncbi:MAG: nicotinamide riboside transporter PnuC [Bacteroidota bacterium]|jgi:nicotinamide mononucleotide transporter
MQEIWQNLVSGMLATTWLEFVAVVFGILSVVYSRAENILVYPTGLINTTLYIYLSVQAGLYAEASVNGYYTIMSVAGWIWWTQKRGDGRRLRISGSSATDWRNALLFFGIFWIVLWWLLSRFTDSSVPIADAFAAASAYTGMWLMARKKLENWIWWIITNIASIPLYFSKGFVFTSFQYLVFLALAILGYVEWRRKLIQNPGNSL